MVVVVDKDKLQLQLILRYLQNLCIDLSRDI